MNKSEIIQAAQNLMKVVRDQERLVLQEDYKVIEDLLALVGTHPTMNVMITEFPDGITIGWDRCSLNNGGCGLSINQCKCKGGPKELKVFEKWRTPEGGMPRYNDPDRGKKVDHVADTISTAVAEAADLVEDALEDETITQERIDSLQAQADEELATNGKSDLFLTLTQQVRHLKLKILQETNA